jgi:uncharacterized membrane protein
LVVVAVWRRRKLRTLILVRINRLRASSFIDAISENPADDHTRQKITAVITIAILTVILLVPPSVVAAVMITWISHCWGSE